eukprot:UN27131
MDMLNHSDKPNAQVIFEDNRIQIKALRPIDKNEEVTIQYKDNLDPRQSFYQFGFLTDNPTKMQFLIDTEDEKQKILNNIENTKSLLENVDKKENSNVTLKVSSRLTLMTTILKKK